ncbi:pyrroline-5-carboxylate reductase [Anaerolineales bacterium HSG6]|nr:pyrroline-5-carboxylate reductase [Anaerolineales bacterium HSG6]MDM8530140.1 pyrroline-5-carboxylate reductase [Anaerolineales bacterium HSG25]
MTTQNNASLQDTKLCFIGAGAMASAMISGLCQKKLLPPANITASDPFSTQLDGLAEKYQVNITRNNLEAVENQDIIVLSIKPQVLAKVAEELQRKLPQNSLVLSIIAGATIGNISQLLRHDRVVRVMPNTPAQIGKGMSVWTSTDMVSTTQKEQTQQILAALGEEVQVDHEDYLDMATALSGGGPAYVFMFMEALIDSAVYMGFTRPVAEKLVYQTVEGSVAYARESELHPTVLRNLVSSPGGTTVEAIYQLEKGGFRTTISKAIWAAYQKSRHLGSVNNDG